MEEGQWEGQCVGRKRARRLWTRISSRSGMSSRCNFFDRIKDPGISGTMVALALVCGGAEMEWMAAES